MIFCGFLNPDSSKIRVNHSICFGPSSEPQSNIIFKESAKKWRLLWSRSKTFSKPHTGVALEAFTGRAPHICLMTGPGGGPELKNGGT